MADHQLQLLYSRQEIAVQVQRLADEIQRDHADANLLLVGVLKGSFVFIADLARALDAPIELDFVRLASYGSEMQSSGIVEIRQDLEQPIRGRDVIIVEDIVDSGQTLETLCHLLQQRHPRTLRVCTLLDKTAERQGTIRPDYVGFSLPRGFVVGYGLDLDEQYRNLPDIYLLHKA